MSQLEGPLRGLVRVRPEGLSAIEDRPSAGELAKAVGFGKERTLSCTKLDGTPYELPVAQCLERDPFPLPPAALREDYGSDENALATLEVWGKALGEALRIHEAIRPHLADPQRFGLLDFGCASGRMLRHFGLQLDGCTPWGCDFDGQNVAWMASRLPAKFRCFQNHAIPHLPLCDGEVDAVVALSVFTHMDLLEDAWLLELRRVVKPGGCLFLSFHSEDSWTRAREREDFRQWVLNSESDRGDVTAGEELLLQPMPEGRTVLRKAGAGVYGAQTLHSCNYVQEHWGRFFEGVRIIPRWAHPEHGEQSAAVLVR